MWVFLLCLTVSFVGVFDRALWTPDEPRVAAISLEMSRTGDAIVPHLAGTPFVEKPPLYFATAAMAAHGFGPLLGNTAAIRLTSVLWGLGAIVMTSLLARRLIGPRATIPAGCFLATMCGFVHELHWIRVDAALLFFVTAAVWCFDEVYSRGRCRLLPLGGLLTAGAFLTKGIVGPVLIGLVWAALFMPWLARRRAWWESRWAWAGAHVAAALILLGLAGGWVVALRVRGGAALWHEWFWDNQVGRLTGTATHLGHLRRGQPFYYVKSLAWQTLPWLPLVALWFVRAARAAKAGRGATAPRRLLLAWSLGSMLFLSLAASKRDIYLLPVLPGLAIMAAEVSSAEQPRWLARWLGIWTWATLLLLALMGLSPLWVRWAPAALAARPELAPQLAFLGGATPRHALVVACLAACVFMVRNRRRLSPYGVPLAATALLYIGGFTVAAKAVDLQKNMGPAFASFAARIPSARRDHVAGSGFSETTAACFYYYAGWSVRQVNTPERLQAILDGNDPEFDSVIVSEPDVAPATDSRLRILAEAAPGDCRHKRPLYWIESRVKR